jgi:hypothetical protein
MINRLCLIRPAGADRLRSGGRRSLSRLAKLGATAAIVASVIGVTTGTAEGLVNLSVTEHVGHSGTMNADVMLSNCVATPGQNPTVAVCVKPANGLGTRFYCVSPGQTMVSVRTPAGERALHTVTCTTGLRNDLWPRAISARGSWTHTVFARSGWTLSGCAPSAGFACTPGADNSFRATCDAANNTTGTLSITGSIASVRISWAVVCVA